MAAATRNGDSDGMSSHAAPLKVFLADDSAPIRARVAGLLAGPALQVVGEAETPQACIAGILATHPDVVVLDVQLDGGQGLEVLRAVRGAAPDIAFVVFSNNAGPAYRKRYLGAGAARFLDKSAEFDQLAGAVSAASHPLPQ
jgi:DNA-binding NarL/FixJ family response regulator